VRILGLAAPARQKAGLNPDPEASRTRFGGQHGSSPLTTCLTSPTAQQAKLTDLARSVTDLDTRQGASAITLVGFDPRAPGPFGTYRQSDSDSGFGIDLPRIGGVLGLIYLAVLPVTTGAAWRASRLPPAEAVRHTE
jgi:hypothetical protein